MKKLLMITCAAAMLGGCATQTDAQLQASMWKSPNDPSLNDDWLERDLKRNQDNPLGIQEGKPVHNVVVTILGPALGLAIAVPIAMLPYWW